LAGSAAGAQQAAFELIRSWKPFGANSSRWTTESEIPIRLGVRRIRPSTRAYPLIAYPLQPVDLSVQGGVVAFQPPKLLVQPTRE
jgi:hypothetical protein